MPQFRHKSRPLFIIQGFKNNERYLNYEGEPVAYVADGLSLDEAQITTTITSSEQINKLIFVLETMKPCFEPVGRAEAQQEYFTRRK